MKRIIFLTITIILLMIMANLVKSIYELYHKKDLYYQTQQQLKQAQQEHAQLQHKLQIVSSKEFVEEEARNKLFLVKPGESIVVLPSLSSSQTESNQTSPIKESNWQQWWDLFF